MANTDSFIDEVTEEVRRDQLYRLFRKWAWLPALVVIVLVGGAAWLEISRSQERATAQAFGSAVLDALDQEEAAARVAALEAIDPPAPEAGVILALLQAGEVASDPESAAAAAERLRAAARQPDLPPIYRDLALLKAHLVAPEPAEDARDVLETIAAPGRPYASLAQEQLALLDIRDGDLEAGIARLRDLERLATAAPGLSQRAGQLVIALESGAQLVDTAPEAPRPELDLPPMDTLDLLPPGTASDAPATAVEDVTGEAFDAGLGTETDAEETLEMPDAAPAADVEDTAAPDEADAPVETGEAAPDADAAAEETP